MKDKLAILSVFAAFLFLSMPSGTEAVDTRQIERVRSKGVLDSEDLQIIDDFVNEAVRELVRTRNFSDVARVRSVILARRSSKASNQAQYAEQFSESANTHISAGFKRAEGITPENRKLKIEVNLLILIDALEDLRLAHLSIGMLKDKNTAIRYWAVHSVTNAGIIKQLNSTRAGDLQLAGRIVEQLKELVEQSSPEILGLMAEFAARVNIVQGEELLLQIADVRMKRYTEWTVKYELLDGAILKLLESKIPSRPQSRAAVARRFGQLYSYVIQRYIKGRDSLSANEKHRLASVLVETEDKCIRRLLGRRTQGIKRAVEQEDYAGLRQEHSSLLGDETRAGQLTLKLKFDYGKTSGGRTRIAPLPLPERPETKSG